MYSTPFGTCKYSVITEELKVSYIYIWAKGIGIISGEELISLFWIIGGGGVFKKFRFEQIMYGGEGLL